MSEDRQILQPGPVFYEVFLGALLIFGTNLKDWSALNGVQANNAKMAAVGAWNGPKARILRQKMVDHIGEDLFHKLYRQRMTLEQRRVA